MTAMIKPATFQEAIDYLELSEEGSIEHRISLLLTGQSDRERQLQSSHALEIATLRKKLTDENKKLDDVNTRLTLEIRELSRTVDKLKLKAEPAHDSDREEYVRQLHEAYEAAAYDASPLSPSPAAKREFTDKILDIASKINNLSSKGTPKGNKMTNKFSNDTLRNLTADVVGTK